MHLPNETVACVHHRVFVVAAIQEYATRKNYEAGQQQQQHFQALLAAVDEVTVEHVRILRRGQVVLRGYTEFGIKQNEKSCNIRTRLVG